MKLLATISRTLVGSLFIVSGLIKANDPLGFSYKLQDYFSADVLGMEWLGDYALALAVFICVVEIVLGVAAIIGAKMRLVSWSLLLMIVFFTFLTFYSAYFDKVTDCGCFGDALKLTPWESFTKDLVLLVFVIIIFIQRGKIGPNARQEDMVLLPVSLLLIAGFSIGVISWAFPVLFSAILFVLMLIFKGYVKNRHTEWLQAAAVTVISVYFTMYCYNHLPIRDFRPYAIGKSIPDQMVVPEGEQPDVYETILTYKNSASGEVKEFNSANYPWDDSTWVWVNTETNLVQKGYEPPIHDFNLISTDGNDYTDDVLAEPVVFLLISKDVKTADEKVQPKVNKLAEQAYNDGYYFYGVSASMHDHVEEFRHKHQSMFDYFSSDETTLKTIIRSNPGLVLLKNGTVAGKWHYNDFPEYEDIKNDYLK